MATVDPTSRIQLSCSLLDSTIGTPVDREDVGECFPVLNTASSAHQGPSILFASTGVAVVTKSLLSEVKIAADTGQPVQAPPKPDELHDNARDKTGSFKWLDVDGDEKKLRQEFIQLLRSRNLPIPKGEKHFHAARVYVDSEQKHRYDLEQWTDYVRLMEDRRANKVEMLMLSNRKAAWEHLVTYLKESKFKHVQPQTELGLKSGGILASGHLDVGHSVDDQGHSVDGERLAAACSVDGQLCMMKLNVKPDGSDAVRSIAMFVIDLGT